MAEWRASGRVCAIRRVAHGLHLVLKCRYVELFDRRHLDLCFAPCLCKHDALSLRLERALRVHDAVALSGRIERCERPIHPLIAHDWNLIVTRASAPLLLNLLHRLWRPAGGAAVESTQ